MNPFSRGGILLALLVLVPAGLVGYRYGARTGYGAFVLLSLGVLLFGFLNVYGA